jgi:drug/metabolite transporter (DMT)-like permease
MPGTRVATVVQLVVGGLVLVVAAAVDGELTQIAWAAIGSPAWMAFGYLVAVDSLAGFALFTWLLRVAPVSLVSTYSYAVPVVAYLVGVLVLGEPFRPLVLLGAAVVIAAVAAEVVSRPR